MQEIFQNQPEPEQRKPLPLNILLGALVIVAIALSFWFAFKSPQGNSSRVARSNASVPMSQAEQTYLRNIQIQNIALSRAENFLHQEVTILDADAVNAGQQTVAGMSITVEFFDDLHQVVLRETRSVLGIPPVPLGPGLKRSFSISFDRVPSSWNMQQPAVQVSYLQLAIIK
jgi:hypothetical protein